VADKIEAKAKAKAKAKSKAKAKAKAKAKVNPTRQGIREMHTGFSSWETVTDSDVRVPFFHIIMG
jgi:hypothetical protein